MLPFILFLDLIAKGCVVLFGYRDCVDCCSEVSFNLFKYFGSISCGGGGKFVVCHFMCALIYYEERSLVFSVGSEVFFPFQQFSMV